MTQPPSSGDTTREDAEEAISRIDESSLLVEAVLAAAAAGLWLLQSRVVDDLIRALLPRRRETPAAWVVSVQSRIWAWQTTRAARWQRVAHEWLTQIEIDLRNAALVAARGGTEALNARQFIDQVRGAWATSMRILPVEAQRAIAPMLTDLRNGTTTLDKAVRGAAQHILDEGVHVLQDSRGRRWQPASYSEMLLRTAAQQAHTASVVAAADDLNTRYVVVSDHHRECPRCRPWEGSLLLTDTGMPDEYAQHTLAEARIAGLFHPHCRHQIHPWWPEWDDLPPPGEPDAALYRASQTQRRYERDIRAAKSRLAVEEALDPRSPQSQQAREAVAARQAALRDHLATHPRLKRARQRELPRPGD